MTKADEVVIVVNEPQRNVAAALAAATRVRTPNVEVICCPPASRPSQEPPQFVAAAMARATAVFAATAFSLSHTEARREASRKGTRIAALPRITEDAFRHAMVVDYAQLKLDGEFLAQRLGAAASCRITSPGGTDVRLRLDGRCAVCDAGDLGEEGAFGNLPAGEAYISPMESDGDGLIVFDGTLAGYGLLREPLLITLEAGYAVDASGEAAEWLLATLDAGSEKGRCIAELGIGTNPRARVTELMLEAEKAIGTAHLAFGTSASFGGVNVANVHIDGLIRAPTIELDGQPVMRDGERVAR